ncbi:MAG: (2Fe-2S)-binding protein [Verrucomicrobiia bacterium]|jgi:aerobic-type carbon monoxide dehydrogenase small subunit (CoxS/CutS family)
MSERPHNEPFDKEISRRSFLKGLGSVVVATAAVPAGAVAAGTEQIEKLGAEKTLGPGRVPITLTVNGKSLKLNLEPRVTLLDALRNYSDLTGTKEVCDRGTCGACTVLLDGKPVYSCMKLAIEAQGHDITTVEGLAPVGRLTDVQQAVVDNDALMCGYCTPGFVMTVTSLLRNNPHPTADEVRVACSGNVCRCGTQHRMLAAVLRAAGAPVAETIEVIRSA